MKKNEQNKPEDITLKSLGARLRQLPDVDVPETLKAKLFAAVPHSPVTPSKMQSLPWYLGIRDFGVTAAAAVLIIALLLLVNYSLSVPPRTSLAEFSDTALAYPKWDQNDFLYSRSNAHAQNPLDYEANKP